MKKLFALLLSVMSALSVMSVTAEEMDATAKAECTKLDNTYMSMKSNYAKMKKENDKIVDAKYHEKKASLSHDIRDLEKKFKALPATTPEAKLLQKKLLKQLQLGRDLTKDEAAAMEKK